MTPAAADPAPAAVRPGHRRPLGDLVLASLVAVTAVASGIRPPRDVDLYWHRVVGRTLLHGWWHASAPDPIAYSPGRPWQPGAWTVEVLYAWLIDAWGYAAVLPLRLVLVLAFAVALAVALRRGRPAWVAATVFGATALPMVGYLQDRPQTFSFVLLVPLAVVLRNGLRGRAGPPWWAYPLVTWAWANIHGYWVMVPVVCVLVALAQVLDRGHDGVRPALGWFARAALAAVAAALTPFGLSIVLAPLRLSESTSVIAEWQPTNLSVLEAWAPALLLALLAVSWARSGSRVPRGTVLVVLSLALFASLAIRNASVAAVLLAPLAADALAQLDVRPRWSPTVPRWSLAAVGVVAAAATAWAYLSIPTIPHGYPTAIAATLARSAGPVRVLTDYNSSGYLRDAGGDRVRVAIDGRADRYGSRTIETYNDMITGKPGWQTTFEQYAPDLAVLHRDDVLVELLQARLRWTVAQTDGEFVLLRPPGA